MNLNRPLVVFLFFLLAGARVSALTVTNEVNGTLDWSSYDSAQYTSPSYVLGGAYFATYFYNGYPQYTNHLYSVSGGGASWQFIYENYEEAYYVPLWNSFAVPGYHWILATDNGGYDSNAVIQWGTNLFSYPPLSFNGTAVTNENIPCVGISYVPLGCLPDASPVPSSLAWLRNTASTNLAAMYGAPIIDLNGILRTNGYYTNALFGYYDGGHPFAAGSLVMALEMLLAQGVETNVGAISLDWSNQLVTATNKATVIDPSFADGTLTFTAHFDRMPMAWDDGTEGWDARGAFTIAPVLGNAFQWTLQVTNLPSGNYLVNIDGSNVVTLSSSQLAAGWNMFTNYNGALWAQRMAVLNAKFDQAGVDHFTRVAHSAGEYGTIHNVGDMVNFGSVASGEYPTKRGTNYIAAVAPWISQVQQYDLAIHNAALQTNHVFTISCANQPQTITFPSPENQIYGVSSITLSATASSGLPVNYSITSGPATVSDGFLNITNVGTVTIQASQPGDATWMPATPVSQTISIAQKALTITGLTAANKTYDATVTASVSTNGATLVGVIGADLVTVSGIATGMFAGQNVASDQTVTISGLSLNGADAGNYSLTQPTTTASITPASTSIAVSSSANPISPGSNVTVTAVVTVLPPGEGTPIGTITFEEGTTVLGIAPANGSPATLDITTLSPGTHVITVEYSGDNNFFGSSTNLNQIIEVPIVAGAVTLQRYPTGGAKIQSAAFLTNATDAPDYTVSLLSISATSAASGKIAMSGGWVYYTPPAGFTNSDIFSYVISDSANRQATGTVTVNVLLDDIPSQNFAPNSVIVHEDSVTLRFLGVPQRTYTIQYSANLVDWQPLGTATASPAGLIIFSDSPPTGSTPRSYRTTYP